MSTRGMRRAGLPVTILAVLLMVAACGSSAASPTPAPTAAPTAAPSRPTPFPTPAADPRADPGTHGDAGTHRDAEGRRCRRPDDWGPVHARRARSRPGRPFEAGIQKGLGSMAGVMQVGVRQVNKDGSPVGLALVMDFPGLALTEQPGFLDSIAGGMAGSGGGKVTSKTIEGQPVAFVATDAATWAVYKHGEGVIAVYAQTAEEATAMVTSLIKANG